MSATMIISPSGVGPLHGFEVVKRAARIVIAGNINATIDEIQRRWLVADEEFENAGFDIGLRAEGVEHVAVEDVHGGPHRSLVAQPIEHFPCVSISAYATRPSGLNAANDRWDVPEISLLAELFVKAGPMTPNNAIFVESVVERRIDRTTEALLATIAQSGNLIATVDSISQPRGGIVNASWTRNEQVEGEAGATYVLHGARFVYALTRRVSRNYS